ncbi:hypothetical protein KWG01_04420 [Acinetobacter pittii]|uniref:hypothetical protein n=1 Tax=Acinetobacter pittii TaxID=48296 RepID=UPI00355BFB81
MNSRARQKGGLFSFLWYKNISNNKGIEMRIITLKDIESGEEIKVQEIDDSNDTQSIDGYITRVIKTKWIYLDGGADVPHNYHEDLRNANLKSPIGNGHIVVDIQYVS